jgi:hypothetical protein
MDARVRLRRGRHFVLGDCQRQVVAGAATTVLFFLLGAGLGWPWQSIGVTGINVAAIGGFVTGLALDRDWVRAALVGCRAALVGFTALAVVVPVLLFALWRAQTGQNFLFISPMLGGVLLLLAPAVALAGAAGGVVGSAIRGTVGPESETPRTY